MTMPKRNMAWFTTGLLLVAFLVGWLSYNGGSYTIEISQQEAQRLIGEALDKRAVQENSVKIESVLVWFENSQIHLKAKVLGVTKGRQVGANIYGVGTPEYRDGSFYFHPTKDIQFSEVKVKKIDGGKNSGSQFFPQTRKLLEKKVEQIIVKNGWEEITDTFKVEFNDWAVSTAQKHIRTTLSNHALYTLNGTKGFAVKAVLDKVESVGDKLLITFSVIQFGYTILVAAIMLVAVITLMFFLIASQVFWLTFI